MVKFESIFQQEVKAPSSAYVNCRDSENPHAQAWKCFIETLWQRYYPYANRQFLKEFRNDNDKFFSRFFEMYLFCTLLDCQLEVTSLEDGPDVRCKINDQVIWFEATAPTAGADNSEDRVSDVEEGEVSDVPDKEIILRYRNAIHEKFCRKYSEYLKRRVGEDDCYVVAIYGGNVPVSMLEQHVPRIVKAVFPVGHLQVHLDQRTGEIKGVNYQWRESIIKSSGAEVSTSIFLQKEYERLSAVLFSNRSPAHECGKLGEEFILVHNPLAKSPLPAALTQALLDRGVEYRCTIIARDPVLSLELQKSPMGRSGSTEDGSERK